jgi:multicomponent Na+:H+ antiporter subunit D
VLRAGMRVFVGLGIPPSIQGGTSIHGETSVRGETRGVDENRETEGAVRSVPVTMLAPVVALLAGGLALGLLPGLATSAQDAAQQLLDSASYAAAALDGIRAVPPPTPGAETWSLSGLLLDMVSTLLALLIAVTAVYSDRLPRLLRRIVHAVRLPLGALRTAHSGHLGDYVAWLLVGVTLLAIGIAVS